jgi:Cysteine rich repeat
MQTGKSGARLIMAATLFGTWLASAFAQQPTSEQISAIRQSCRSDFMSHCAGVQPGGKDALACLRRNAGSVSAPCKSALDAVGPKPGAESAAPASGPAPAAAPTANESEPAAPPPPSAGQAAPTPPPATAAPGAEMRPASPQLAAVRAACRSDFGVHCPGVRPGGAAALRCLQVNAPALSPACRSAVQAMSGKATSGKAMGEGDAPPPPPAAPPPPGVAPLGPIPPMRPRQALEILSFCGPEQRALCAGVPPGGGRIIACLADNAPHLSPECYGAIARAIR